MRKTALLLAFVAAAAWGQPNVQRHPPKYTVATAPTCSDGEPKIYFVTDGNSSTDCATGSGSTEVLCQCKDGSVSVVAGGGGGGNSFETINAPSGTDPVAESSTDTLNITCAGGLSCTGDASTDTLALSMGTAATATALAANGANCSAGQFPLGVDASGAVESCSTSLSGNADTATTASGLSCTNCVDGTEIAMGSDARGDVLYYNGTDWARLAAGSADYVLESGGAGADPAWAVPARYLEARKGSVGTITKGQAVYVSGYNIGVDDIEVELCDADDAAKMPCIGLAAESITNAATGLVIVSGNIVDVNTVAYAVNDALYISTTAGTLTNSRPSGETTLVQKIGEVLRSNASNGAILIFGAGRSNDVPNIADDSVWVGSATGVATATSINDCDAGSVLNYDTTANAFGCTADDDVPDSGDFGALALTGDVSSSGLTTTIGSDKVLESMLKAVDAANDEECLTYEVTTGDFEWQSCGTGIGGSTGATDNSILRADGVGGATLQASAVTINDTTGTMTWPSSQDSSLTFRPGNGGYATIDVTPVSGNALLSMTSGGTHPIRLNSSLFVYTVAGGSVQIPSSSALGFRSSDNYTSGSADAGFVRVSAGLLRCTDGSTGICSGFLTSRSVEANTAGSGTPNALAATESWKVLTNEGVTAANYHTLPTAVAGYVFTFIVQDVDGLRVTANTGDTIRIAGTASTSGGYCESTTIGDTVTLVAINATEWIAISYVGTGFSCA